MRPVRHVRSHQYLPGAGSHQLYPLDSYVENVVQQRKYDLPLPIPVSGALGGTNHWFRHDVAADGYGSFELAWMTFQGCLIVLDSFR